MAGNFLIFRWARKIGDNKVIYYPGSYFKETLFSPTNLFKSSSPIKIWFYFRSVSNLPFPSLSSAF
jgi:hypothetical protein